MGDLSDEGQLNGHLRYFLFQAVIAYKKSSNHLFLRAIYRTKRS